MAKPTFTDEFKQGVVQYVLDHPNESKVSDADKNNGAVVSRGSGNFSSDEAKEIA